MSMGEKGKRLQVAGEDGKEHLERGQKQKARMWHSGGHINDLSLFLRVTGHSTGTQKHPACPLFSNLTRGAERSFRSAGSNPQ